MVQWWQTDRKCKQIAEPLARMDGVVDGEGGRGNALQITLRGVIISQGKQLCSEGPSKKHRVFSCGRPMPTYRPFCRLRDSTCIETLPSSRVLCSGVEERMERNTREVLSQSMNTCPHAQGRGRNKYVLYHLYTSMTAT